MRNPRPSFFIVHPSLTLDRRPSLFIFHCSLFILLSLFILHSSFFITGCSSSTKPKTGSLSGRVILVNDTGDPSLDPVDFSGVTVALYELAVLDTTIVRINQEYPQIGVQISQETEFDHRLQNPVRVVTTDPDGSYSFDKVTLGTYNLVALKPGWGYSYSYSVPCTETHDQTDIELFPERAVATVNGSAFTFLSGRHYVADAAALFLEPVEIQTGSVIRIAPGESISFYGPITVTEVGGHRFRFTTDNNAYSTAKLDSLETYDRILFASETNNYIHSGLIQAIQNGLQFQNGSAEISNTVFSGGGVSFVGSNLPSTVQSSIIRGFNQVAQNFYGPTTISRNIYAKNTDKCMILYDLEGTVSDNYFVDNWNGIQPFRGNVTIANCAFDRNFKAIAPCASNAQLLDNDFYNDTYNIEFNAYLAQTGTIEYCDPVVTGNNFHYTHKIISNRTRSGLYHNDDWFPSGIVGSINCPNNYWKAADPILVFEGAENLNIIYNPRRIVPNPGAGIR